MPGRRRRGRRSARRPRPHPRPPRPRARPAPAPADDRSPEELNDEGFALIQRGDYAAAVPLLERSVQGYRDQGRTSELGYAFALYNLAYRARADGPGGRRPCRCCGSACASRTTSGHRARGAAAHRGRSRRRAGRRSRARPPRATAARAGGTTAPCGSPSRGAPTARCAGPRTAPADRPRRSASTSVDERLEALAARPHGPPLRARLDDVALLLEDEHVVAVLDDVRDPHVARARAGGRPRPRARRAPPAPAGAAAP